MKANKSLLKNACTRAFNIGRKSFLHLVVVPSTVAASALLCFGPGNLYDSLTDIDTALLYTSLDKSLSIAERNDTQSNLNLINNSMQSFENQTSDFVSGPIENFAVTPADSDDSLIEPKSIPRAATTAVVAQWRINSRLNTNMDRDQAVSILRNILTEFEFSRYEFKSFAGLVLTMIWGLVASASVITETLMNRRKELHA